MKIVSENYNFFTKIKLKLFPFYKSKEIIKLFKILENNKSQNKEVAMFVGGCVRNFLTGKKIDDIDIATIFTPEQLQAKFNNTEIRLIETGIKHGTLTGLIGNLKFEITTLRKDLKTDGRHAEISFTEDWNEDSARRDFTINSIYLNSDGKIYDPQLGVKDLRNKVVKFIGDPEQRIQEDYLRIIRYIRFAIQYDSEIEDTIISTINLNINKVKKLSKERILDELFKILKLNNFHELTKKVKLNNIFMLIFPELKYIHRLNKFSDNFKSEKLKNELILSILLIDETSNHEYFCHKYNISNNLKEKLELYFNSFNEIKKDINFFKTNLKNNCYQLGKITMIDLNKLNFFLNKKMTFKEYFNIYSKINKTKIPTFPYDGKYLLKKGLNEGKNIGLILKKIEQEWIKKEYFLSEKNINDIIVKYK